MLTTLTGISIFFSVVVFMICGIYNEVQVMVVVAIHWPIGAEYSRIT